MDKDIRQAKNWPHSVGGMNARAGMNFQRAIMSFHISGSGWPAALAISGPAKMTSPNRGDNKLSHLIRKSNQTNQKRSVEASEPSI